MIASAVPSEHLGHGQVGGISGAAKPPKRQPVADVGVAAAVLQIELVVHGLSLFRRRPPYLDALDHVYRTGFNYSKAEVMLLNLCRPSEYIEDLFAESQPGATTKLMSILDEINQRWGRGTLRSASVPSNPDWGMRREMMSQSYTTRLDQLWRVSCS